MKFVLFVVSLLLGALAYGQAPDNHLKGKIINVIGDSYVRNHVRPFEESWHYLVAERNGMTYRNYGRNGNCVAFDRTKEGFGESMLSRYKEMNDTADYVLVIAGHNDAGMINNSADSLEIFKSCLHQLCEGLIEKYPTAKIAFVTPWHVNRPGFPEVTDAIIEICGEYSIPVLDASRESGIYVNNDEFRKIYFQGPKDTAHLNARGHERFYPRGLAFIMGL